MTTKISLKIEEIELAFDGMEDGYRIVRLADGRHAFVWGNIRARVGDTLPAELGGEPGRADGRKGWEAYSTFGDAEAAWENCAEALIQSGAAAAGNGMLKLI